MAAQVDAADAVWTEERIRQYGVRMPSVEAARAVYGCGVAHAYGLLRAGEDLEFRVLRKGRQYVTPTADVLELLGLNERAA
ncbi:hypothetical protein CFP71_01330 [Amycolatopsis thailandensis]|uniref:Uncharacterized protein n=1 Tax=Amycolatopsis thailandensis TaxID=589330 RepID=A0A229SIS4_9PSEU|nr:hypothetical protein [Amycolatopsis thailandensis]OXM58684.1 hypothetical protein CFP71_01330 [Amycolatopsis thailandensis]